MVSRDDARSYENKSENYEQSQQLLVCSMCFYQISIQETSMSMLVTTVKPRCLTETLHVMFLACLHNKVPICHLTISLIDRRQYDIAENTSNFIRISRKWYLLGVFVNSSKHSTKYCHVEGCSCLVQELTLLIHGLHVRFCPRQISPYCLHSCSPHESF